MRDAARDQLAAIRCDRALQELRDRWLAAHAAGRPADAATASGDEDAACAEAWRSLDQPVEAMLVGRGAAAPATDGGRLALALVLVEHRRLAALPTLGDPAHAP